MYVISMKNYHGSRSRHSSDLHFLKRESLNDQCEKEDVYVIYIYEIFMLLI